MKFRGENTGDALLIVTGVSCSGKTTLAEKLSEVLQANLLSVDAIKQEVYDSVGFLNLKERGILCDLAYDKFKASLITLARDKDVRNIVVEYPFSTKWQTFFNYIGAEYGYEIIIVNCIPRDLGVWWQNKCKRDIDYSVRPKALVARRYVKDEVFEPEKIGDLEVAKAEKDAYISRTYNSLYGDYSTSSVDVLQEVEY